MDDNSLVRDFSRAYMVACQIHEKIRSHHEAHEGPSAAKPHQISEYLPQRREGAKVLKKKKSSLNLASLRLRGRMIRLRDVSHIGKFARPAQILRHSNTKDTKVFDNKDCELRALRVLRGENLTFYFGCGFAALGCCTG
jgi:hypothetical protein